MNKFKINSNKPKLMLNDYKSRSSLRKEDLDFDKEIAGVSNGDPLVLHDRPSESAKPLRRLSRISATYSKDTAVSFDGNSSKPGKDAIKR